MRKLARRLPILATRTKGPSTPNFRKFYELLESGAQTSIAFDRDRISDQHGGVGIAMAFVVDLLEQIEGLSKHDARAVVDGQNVYINQEIFFLLIRTVDVYAIELYSILDYLAVELAEIFRLEYERCGEKKEVEYFFELLKVKSLPFGLKAIVQALIKEPWFTYFHDLRGRVTHRAPVHFVGLGRRDENGDFINFRYPFLPDNPKEITLTFSQRLDVLDESKKWLGGIFDFVERVCGTLLTLFQTSPPS